MAISKLVAAPLLAFIAIVQAIRFFMAWPISVNGIDVPVWPSAIAAVIFTTVAVLVWREKPRSGI